MEIKAKVELRFKKGEIDNDRKRKRAAEKFCVTLAAQLLKASAEEPTEDKTGE